MTLRNAGILLALSTGIRIGELCALRWKEIDIEERTINVERTLQRIYVKENGLVSSQIIISAPKSKKSIRTIPISEKMAEILKIFKSNDRSYFLTGKEDRFIEPRAYREYYNRLMSRNHMRFVSFHGLRHTFATRCIDAGCDCKTLSEILGHADVGTTMQLYVHSSLDKKRNCIEKVELFWKELL